MIDSLDTAKESWPAYAGRFAPDTLLVVDAEGVLLWGSPSAFALLGYDADPMLGVNVFSLVHGDDLGYAAGALQETVRKDGLHYPVEIRIKHADGRWVPVEITANTPDLDDGTRNVILSLRPISERDMLPGRRRDFEAVFAAIAASCAGATWQEVDAIARRAIGELGEFFHAAQVHFAIATEAGTTFAVEVSWTSDTDDGATAPRTTAPGWGLEQLPAHATFVDDVATIPTPTPFAAAAPPAVRSQLVVPARDHDVPAGALVVQWAESGDPYWDDALGVSAEALARILLSTLLRSRDESAVYHQSLHDPLTGLANRTKLLLDLGRALAGLPDERPAGLALLFCDLDGFKRVNDEHGHAVGDRVLLEMADRMTAALRPGDSVSRIGGDEFVVLCHRIHDPNATAAVAARIRDAVASTPPTGLTECLDLSVGVAWTDVERDADDLLREADLAMYGVKQHRADATAAD